MKNENFVVYGQWLDAIKNSVTDEQVMKEICWRIMEYGVYGEYEVSNDATVNLMLNMVIPQINKAKDNYAIKVEGGKVNGRRKVVDDDMVRKLARDGMSAQQIAKTLSISRESVYHSEGWKSRKVKEEADPASWSF